MSVRFKPSASATAWSKRSVATCDMRTSLRSSANTWRFLFDILISCLSSYSAFKTNDTTKESEDDRRDPGESAREDLSAGRTRPGRTEPVRAGRGDLRSARAQWRG